MQASALSLALVVANHLVDSQLKRNLNSGGAVSFTADGSSTNSTEAVASSAGADEKKDGSQGSTDSSNKDVNGKADANLDVAKANDSSGKTTGQKTPPAKSGEGGGGGTKVTVAAAVGIAIVTSRAIAKLPDLVDVTTPGAVNLASPPTPTRRSSRTRAPSRRRRRTSRRPSRSTVSRSRTRPSSAKPAVREPDRLAGPRA